MSDKINFFITGATGFIGGSVVLRLLNHPKAASFHLTVLVRAAEKAEKFKTLGINAVVGSHSDLPLVEKLASEADVVIAMADADNLEAAQATLKGLKKRHTITGVKPIFIHTSGTGVLADTAGGMYAYDTIYNDADPDQIETLPPTQLHRNVDLELLAADQQGYLNVYIVVPSTIYGIATGKLVELGLQNPHSIQVPALVDASLARGQGGMVGEGKNLWPNVHVEDVADLYVVLYDSIVAEPDKVGHGREGIYFGENGEHSLYDVGKAIAKALVDAGKGRSPEPTTFTQEEIEKYFGGSDYLGSNSRCRGNRSRSIGWKPTHTTTDFLGSIEAEVEAAAKRNPAQLR
ncbi:hypothetical protein BDZ94DRAFT_1319443 [Collybia nuda]|uniref:NAD-dependent epimerase/dehydratase domain-containing protein n=1 Tax=Collybia nuda TaxID=64659 RepID=A0A9P5YAH0_9AGAR|nr:hypothetical protein BDZ94DRAFT_1319443 [Collybia nuda]